MTATTRIALLRHFPTEWNDEGRLQGRTDVPLSPASRAEIATLRLPEGWDEVPVVSSPLSRAVETARAMAGAREIRTDARLVEMDFGGWEGAVSDDLVADPEVAFGPVETWTWHLRPPGGESPAEMAARLQPAMAEIAVAGPALVVCHRGVIRCLLAQASGWAYEGPEPFRIRRAAIHEIELAPDGRPVALHPPVKLVPR
ncbi:histidine phosphatase family protein [Oceanicella sp. SM1341]|uniref:histidine phosphatase family protein n=1 Tax=Oceanicella sp. SM1341 TaxID=1548889 RepID=UPI000E4C8214|nr:histidine phosphatase family protein [Oceanicella sp. SM1341]